MPDKSPKPTPTHCLNADTVDNLMEDLQDHFELVDSQIAQWARNYGPGHIQHYRDIITRVGRIIDEDNITQILDIGAVPGHISAMLKHVNLNVSVVDIAPERAKDLFESMQIPTYKVELDFEPLPFDDDHFDLVLCCEVLEHLRLQPLAVLKQILRVLRPGGHLLLSVPNITPLMRWRFLLGRDFQGNLIEEFEKTQTIGHMGHFRLYSRREVEQILSYVGFQIVKVDYGGKIVPDQEWDAHILRWLMPHLMRNQVYFWARKPNR
jgi:SAM-dependent methyltransferase